MTELVTALRRAGGLRRTLAGLPALFFTVLALCFAPAAEAATDRPTAFMRHVAKELMAASSTGSPHAMARVIRLYGDLPDIGLYSLGSYMNRLPRDRRSSYYDGVARFMGRYFIAQAQHYQIAKVEVFGPSIPASWGHKVESRVTLKDGSTYRVRWLVVRRSSGFKVRDVSVLGFWLTPFQRKLFEGYIDKNGGNVRALLSALGG